MQVKAAMICTNLDCGHKIYGRNFLEFVKQVQKGINCPECGQRITKVDNLEAKNKLGR